MGYTGAGVHPFPCPLTKTNPWPYHGTFSPLHLQPQLTPSFCRARGGLRIGREEQVQVIQGLSERRNEGSAALGTFGDTHKIETPFFLEVGSMGAWNCFLVWLSFFLFLHDQHPKMEIQKAWWCLCSFLSNKGKEKKGDEGSRCLGCFRKRIIHFGVTGNAR